MKLRKYESADCPVLAKLFYETVHEVNRKDYSQSQLHAWATGTVNILEWDASFLANHTVIAEMDGIITGFCDMDHTGYLDRLYVHHNYQGQGIATAMVNALEQQAKARGIVHFTTHASITAKPFFERRGYQVVKENTAVCQGIALTNFIMEKNIS